MVTGPDEWNHVETRHLDGDTEKKTRAVKMKESLIRIQEDRVIVKNNVRIDSPLVREGYITSVSRLNLFCEEVLEQLENSHRIIFLETWGDSDKWEEGRKKIDGDRFQRNEESIGVVGIRAA